MISTLEIKNWRIKSLNKQKRINQIISLEQKLQNMKKKKNELDK